MLGRLHVTESHKHLGQLRASNFGISELFKKYCLHIPVDSGWLGYVCCHRVPTQCPLYTSALGKEA